MRAHDADASASRPVAPISSIINSQSRKSSEPQTPRGTFCTILSLAFDVKRPLMATMKVEI
jgi:hypothetical protein